MQRNKWGSIQFTFFSNFDIAHDRLVESSQHHRKTLIICHKAIYILHTFFSISFRSVTFLAGNTQKNKNKSNGTGTGRGRGKREKNRPRTQRQYRFECTSTIQRFIKRKTREMESKKISRDSYTFAFHSESIRSLDIDCILEMWYCLLVLVIFHYLFLCVLWCLCLYLCSFFSFCSIQLYFFLFVTERI